jgi:hypothetical protein
MDKITKFDPATCRALSDRIKAALQPLAESLGVTITMGGGKYEAGYYDPKLRVSVVGADGTIGSPEAAAFRQLAHLYGLKAEDLGKTFRAQGDTLTITGLRTRAAKRPIVARATSGKSYVFPAEDVKRLLGA